MDELAVRLDEVDMSSYLDRFIAHGFDTWGSLQNITAQDLEALGVLHPSRQKLLRFISQHKPAHEIGDENCRSGRKRSMAGAADALSPGKVPRRKYKRHPKPDANAPERPLTAYVRFSKDKRREYQERRLSFSELAKQIGTDWQDLSPTTKNKYLSDASADWTNFRKALDDYHATPQYADYVQYLRDFASENPDSNVKLPQPDGSSSPSQFPAASWDADGSPTSDDERPPAASDTSAAPLSHDFDSHHFQYESEHELQGQPTFLTQNAMSQHTAMNPMQDFNYQSNMAFQGFGQASFTDPWPHRQRQSMHLNTIGPSSRFSRTNTSLSQALHRASDTRALQLQHPQQSSNETTPTSDLSAGRHQSSSLSSLSTMLNPEQAGAPIQAEGLYASAMMPNSFAHSYNHTLLQHGMQQNYQTHAHAQLQQQQQSVGNSDMHKQPQVMTPSHPEALNAAFNVTYPYYHNDLWMSGLLEQDFISQDPSSEY